MSRSDRPALMVLTAAALAMAVVTAVLRLSIGTGNHAIPAFAYLLIVLVVATMAPLWAAIATSVVAVACVNFFFMPPAGTFILEDPLNWVALGTFLAVSVVASNLSSQARLQAREAAAKSALLASLAHDLRTPLTAIRVAAANLQASWLRDEDRREQGEVVLAEVERLNGLFQNILEMARIDAGALAAERRWVHPSEIVEAARDYVAHALASHRLDVIAEADPLVHLDPRLTAAALAHVLENAAHYSPAGSSITVRTSASAEGLTIAVCDRGPGIAPADLPHVFDRFYRGTEAKGRVSGTGMGLSIARGMLAAQHGRIRAENCADGGALFTIVVPAATGAHAAAAALE